MSAPVSPADFKNVIISPTATFCLAFVKLFLRLPVLISQTATWALTSSGNFSNEFLRLVFGSGHVKFGHIPGWQSTYWLPCDGGEYDTATYPELSAVIAGIYGTAASGKFRVPDLRGRAPVGNGTLLNTDLTTGNTYSVGTKYGAEQVVLTQADMAQPRVATEVAEFIISESSTVGSNNSLSAGGMYTKKATAAEVFKQDAPAGHQNVTPALALNAWIKT